MKGAYKKRKNKEEKRKYEEKIYNIKEEIKEEPKYGEKIYNIKEEIKEEPKYEEIIENRKEEIKEEPKYEEKIDNIKEEKEENPEQVEKSEEESDMEEDSDKEKPEEEKNRDNKSNNCSSKNHKEKEAKIFCIECKINMCNTCEKYHSELFSNHHIYNIDSKAGNTFTGYCQEKNHNIKLQYYCKDHNTLCCAACLCKIKNFGNGIHNACKVCSIYKIKNEKKNKLLDNIKYLENYSKSLKDLINDLKNLYETITLKKEKLKEEIQKTFTKIRSAINNREDQLLLEVDSKFDELFFKEELIKESEKLPNMVKVSLEKGKISEEDWNEKNKLRGILNECINIENIIKDIGVINDKIRISNEKKKLEISFEQKNEEILNKIKAYGNIKENYKKIYNDLSDKKEIEDVIKNEKILEKEKIEADYGVKLSISSYKANY